MRELDQSVAALHQRKATLDAVLLANAVGTFAVITGAWFYRLLEVEIARIAWMFLGYGVTQLILGAVLDRLHSRRLLLVAVGFAELLAVTFLSVVWHFVGGVENPAFLFALILPVFAAGALQLRWLSYAAAAVSIILVSLVAFTESPELFWYAEQLGLPVQFISPIDAFRQANIFPGMETTPSALLVMMAGFAALQIAVAFVSGALSSKMLRIGDQVLAPLRQGGGEVTRAAIVEAPSPTAIVYVDSGMIHLASRSFVNQMLIQQEELAGKTLVELIRFEDASQIRAAMRSGGKFSRIPYHIGPERRLANIAIHLFSSNRQKFALIAFEELIESVPSNVVYPVLQGGRR